MNKDAIKQILKGYVRGDVTLEDLQVALGSRRRFRFWDTNERAVTFSGPLPRVPFDRTDIDRQLQRFLSRTISARELSDWAGGIRLSGCFFVDADDQESSDTWDLLDEIMSPDVWGDITVESVIDLRRRLENGANGTTHDGQTV